VSTEPISLAGRSSTFSTTTTALPNVPGVRVREGQIVDVTVRISPVPAPTAAPENRPAAP
jgi:hypothetical protein